MRKITILAMFLSTLLLTKAEVFAFVQDNNPDSISATYTDGDLDVGGSSGYDPECSEILTISLPDDGNDWLITSVDVQYDITAQGGAWMVEQRSQLHLVNSDVTEDEVFNGSGSTAGTFNYDRQDLDFANGIFASGTDLEFELRAWRTWPVNNDDCSTEYQVINNNTWTVTVTFEEAPDCQFPSGLSVDNITEASAEFSWTASPSEDDGYEYVVMNAGDAPEVSTALMTGTVPSGETDVAISGLDAQTNYSFYVRTICEDDEESSWSTVLNFETACGAIGDFVTDFSNDETGDVPECWFGITNSTGASPNLEVTTLSNPEFGDQQVRFQSSGDEDTEHFLATPELNNLIGNDKRVRFSARQLTATHSNVMEVGTMSDPEDEETFTSLQTIDFDGNSMSNYSVELVDITSDQHIAFRVTFSNTFSTVVLDQVIYEDLPSCPEPNSIQEISFGVNSIDVEWESVSSAEEYEIAYGEEGFDPDEDGMSLIVDGEETETTIEDLEEDTTFDIYVRSLCANDEESTWTGPISVSTIFPGAACSAPIEITALPFNTSDDTDNYGNFVSSGDRPEIADAQVDNGTGSGSYLNANEAVYSFTPSEDGVFNVDLSETEDSWIGLWMFEGCPFNNTIGYHTATSGTTRSLPELSLQAGVEYFIVVSSWPATSGVDSTPYNLNVEQVLCSSPTNLDTDLVGAIDAEFSWDAGEGEEGGYEYFVMADGDNPEDDDSVIEGTTDTGETSILVEGLEDATSYEFFVRTLCADEDTSDFVSLSFTTQCLPAELNYFEDFTGFPFNYNTGEASICWAQGSGFFETVGSAGWGQQNFNNDASNPNGTAMYINLFSSLGSEDWATSQTIDLGDGSPENVLSFDALVIPWTGSDIIDDMGDHEVHILISEDGGQTWDIDEAVVSYVGSNAPGDIDNTQEVISLADYSGEIVIGFYAVQDGTVPDLRFYIDNLFVGVEPAFANVQVVHNSPDPAASSVDVYVNGDLLPDLTGVDFRTATEFLQAPAEEEITIDIVPAGEDLADSVFTQDITLDEDENYIIVANGFVGGDFELSVFSGAQETSDDSEETAVLVHHGSPDAPLVNVANQATGDNLVNEIAFTEFQGYLDLPVDDYVLDITDVDGNVVASYGAPLSTLDLGGEAITVIASGLLAADPNDADAFGLWVATAAGGDLVELPLIEPDPVFANVQVIHNSPDPAASSVDVFLNGEPVDELNGVMFRNASQFLPVPAEVEITIDIVPAGGDLADSVFTQSFTLDEDENYVIVANGVLDSDDFITDNTFGLDVYEGARTIAEDEELIDLLVHHGSPDAPAVDVGIQEVGVVVDNIAYPEFEGYLSVDENNVIIEIFATGDLDPVALFQADLAELNLAGSAITVVASGFFGDDAMQNDNSFGLWVATAAGGELIELPQLDISTEDFNSNNFSYYPVPVKNNLNIESMNTVDQVEVFNTLGQRVISTQPKTDMPVIDMQALQTGVYLMKVEINGNQETFQIIKE